MTADEIRKAYFHERGALKEIAAQLAELNVNLERLRLNVMIGSSPLMSHQLLLWIIDF